MKTKSGSSTLGESLCTMIRGFDGDIWSISRYGRHSEPNCLRDASII